MLYPVLFNTSGNIGKSQGQTKNHHCLYGYRTPADVPHGHGIPEHDTVKVMGSMLALSARLASPGTHLNPVMSWWHLVPGYGRYEPIRYRHPAPILKKVTQNFF